MDSIDMDVIKLAQSLVRIDSSNPGACERQLGEFLWKLLDRPGIELTKDEILPGRYNIMAKIRGETDDPGLIYICHMDTVPLGEGWSFPPLSGHVTNNRLYGRGSCDMKSGLACAVSAFCSLWKHAKGQMPKNSFSLIFTVDEEDAMKGVESAIKAGWVTKNSWVLDTEPTNGQIQAAHKGRTWFEIHVEGITAHASTPWKGADAIAAMSEIIVRLRKEIQQLPVHMDLGKSTVTFGQINGGYRPYVVPDSCTVTVDMRLVPPTDTKSAARLVEQAIAMAEDEIPGIQGSYQITGDRPYVEKHQDSLLLSSLSEVCHDLTGFYPEVNCFPGYTDTAVIAGKLKNTNYMSYGPGNLELAHKPDEYVPCHDILRCHKVLEKLAFQMTGFLKK